MEKLVHLVGFITRIYHDARSPERHVLVYFVSLHMFRLYLGPSSGGTTVCIQQLVLIIFRGMSVVLVGFESNQYNRQSSVLLTQF